MIRRAALPLVLSMSLACTSKETIAPGAQWALARSTSDDFIRVPSEKGGTIEFGPNATLHFDGAEVPASEVYLTEWGLVDKSGAPLASWEEARHLGVEQIDGAATVAVTATAALAVVAIAALLKGGGPNLGGSKGGGGSAPKNGGGTPTPPAARSAPNPSPIIPDPNPAVTEVAFRTLEVVANSTGPSVGVATDEPETSASSPLFSRGARRRAIIRALARLEGGACWPSSSGDCIVSGGRVGVRILDMFELTGGVRVESNALSSRPLAVFGGMLHGEIPGAHWFALAVGASVALDDLHVRVLPQLAARFRPVRGFWIGLLPIIPVYSTDTGGWTVTSGAELTGEL